MRKASLFFLCLVLFPQGAWAQGAAPELFGVREVIINPAQFDDVKAASTCGVTREKIGSALAFIFHGTTVPAIADADAKPPSLGIARIQLVPEVFTYANESLDCVSWVSLTAESHANAVISPVTTLRSVKVVYWQQHTKVVSGMTLHDQRITDVLQKMALQFAQQYRADQPVESIK